MSISATTRLGRIDSLPYDYGCWFHDCCSVIVGDGNPLAKRGTRKRGPRNSRVARGGSRGPHSILRTHRELSAPLGTPEDVVVDASRSHPAQWLRAIPRSRSSR